MNRNMRKNNYLKIHLSVALMSCLILSGCPTPTVPSGSEQKIEATSKPGATIIPGNEPTSNAKPAPYINPGDGAASDSDSAKSAAPASGVYPTSAPSAMASSVPAATSGSGSTADTATGGVSYEESQRVMPTAPAAKKLSAGNIDDNATFTEYLEYLTKYGANLTDKSSVLKVNITNRFTISVMDKDQKSISDAVIQITKNGSTVFSGKSYSNGKTLFFPTAVNSLNSDCQQQDCTSSDYSVTVQKGNNKVTKNFNTSAKNWNVELTDKRDQISNPNLDIVFLVDATGSMGDEISSIQNSIKDITAKIQNLTAKPKIRYSLVSYKDRSDDYRVKRYDFTSSLPDFQEILNELSAGGGGDYPESMNEGLHHAIEKVSWTTEKDAVRLVFLVADAPPHLDYSDDYKYTDEMTEAVKKGIKIYPIAASGLSNSGEYIFRQLAQFTLAKFLFLTYGGDEQNAGTTPHHVGEFQENNLDDLVVNIVKEELVNLN